MKKYGYVDHKSPDLQAKVGGDFGLNQKCYVTKLVFSDTAGKDGAPGNAVLIDLQVGDKEFKARFYEVTSVYHEDGSVQINENSPPELIEKAEQDELQRQACIIQAVTALGVNEDQLQTAFSEPVDTFDKWAKIVVGLLPSDYTTRPVDVFLEYQWKISPNRDRTYLQLPKNMKGGEWMCKHVRPEGGEFEAVNDDSGLRYVDGANNTHPFTRSKAGFMDTNKAVEQRSSDQQPETKAPAAKGEWT